ncbi:MAG: VWA domain-containing protein [Thermomicrobiales bacterium]|nr:VWA domain-containing protein [Thermomicrobiales bacterium]
MNRRAFISLMSLVALSLSLLFPVLARADGLIIVEPPTCDPACPINEQLEVTSHKVDVTIADQVATTTIDQVFHNPNDWVAEGTYIFPLPEGATVDKFTMIVDGEPIEAKILSAEEARAIYNEIVRSMRDPALLEYVGNGAIQASIFPIEPGGDRRIQIEYQQVLTAEAGLIRYSYPLNTERFSAAPLQNVSVRVAVESKEPVRAVYSPSHQVALDRADDFHFVAGWEDSNVIPTTDFELIYTVSQDQIGANLLSYVDPTTSEGYFMLLAAPGIDAQQTAIAKDVIVVLDTSGSMEGEKIEQAKQALIYVLEHLNSSDRFNVVEFSTGVRFYANELKPQSDAINAVQWASNLQATGGTDINRALLEGMNFVDPARPTYIIFLTDGLPTEGETEVGAILNNVQNSAPANVRLFAFGVGDDVDTILLDSLVQEHHGATTYVRPGERIDEAVSLFYGKVSTPVLTDVQVKLGDVIIEEIYPQPLPDIFAGTQLVVVGKYRQGGPAPITLTGNVNGQPQTFTYQDQTLVSAGGDDFLPRLWATRKIGYLLNQIRLNGENAEWVQAIVDLSVRYGIVTPYTSYLITEDDILTAQGRAAAAEDESAKIAAEPTMSTGSGAVEEADAAGAMAGSDSAYAVPADAAVIDADGNEISVAETITTVGNLAFVNQEGGWI